MVFYSAQFSGLVAIDFTRIFSGPAGISTPTGVSAELPGTAPASQGVILDQ